jgi:hypothetical protein
LTNCAMALLGERRARLPPSICLTNCAIAFLGDLCPGASVAANELHSAIAHHFRQSAFRRLSRLSPRTASLGASLFRPLLSRPVRNSRLLTALASSAFR